MSTHPSALHSLRRHPIRVAAVAVGLAALAPIGIGSASASTGGATRSAPKPTIVLVHGAWADGSSWSGDVRLLQRGGYTVDVAPNPLSGLYADSAVLVDYLATIRGPVILVGHSYGGAVITAAATGDRNVKALVYVDAYIPDLKQSIGQLSGPKSALAPATTNPASVFNLVPYPGAPKGVVDTYVLPKVFEAALANGLPPAQAEELAASQPPTSLLAIGEPLATAPAWKTIPSWDLVGTQDKIIPEAQQLAMAKHAHAHVHEIKSGHLSLISHPGAVTGLIERVAQKVG